MLSAMSETGADYADVLAEAQRLGYAEADPTDDVTGKDAAAKMAIMASIAFHSRVNLDDVAHEGITKITAVDIAHGRRLGLALQAARRRPARRRRHERARLPGLHPQ